MSIWITDHLGLGGRDYIGAPKQPAATICQLENDRYQKRLFRPDNNLSSTIFLELQLNAGAVFAAGQSRV